MNRLTRLVNRFSFSRKLAFTFFICSLLTFVVIDVIMNILYSTVIVSTNTASTFNTQAFSQFSNHQILSSTDAWLISGLDLFEQILVDIFTTYLYFQAKPDIYVSFQLKGVNPPPVESFDVKNYDSSSIYFYTPNSTFHDEPYLDKVLASVATQHYPSYLKRVNVVYQSKIDPNDISIRTAPATNDFYIPNADVISQRIADSVLYKVIYSDLYYDEYSISDNTTLLIAMRYLFSMDSMDYNMLIEIQVEKVILDYALSFVFSFPNTQIYIVKLFEGDRYSILGQNTPVPPDVNLRQYFEPGSQNISINSYQFLVTTKYLLNNSAYGSTITDMRLITFLNKTQTQVPNIVLYEFLKNQYSALLLILYGWTFIVMLVVSWIGVAIGDIIFSYFSLIRKKCKQYLHNPSEIKKIDKEINKQINKQMRFGVQLEARNQLLLENIVSIMHNIEAKKNETRKKYKITYDSYPLNPLYTNFQNRMRKIDYDKLNAIKRIIRQKINHQE